MFNLPTLDGFYFERQKYLPPFSNTITLHQIFLVKPAIHDHQMFRPYLINMNFVSWWIATEDFQASSYAGSARTSAISSTMFHTDQAS